MRIHVLYNRCSHPVVVSCLVALLTVYTKPLEINNRKFGRKTEPVTVGADAVIDWLFVGSETRSILLIFCSNRDRFSCGDADYFWDIADHFEFFKYFMLARTQESIQSSSVEVGKFTQHFETLNFGSAFFSPLPWTVHTYILTVWAYIKQGRIDAYNQYCWSGSKLDPYSSTGGSGFLQLL